MEKQPTQSNAPKIDTDVPEQEITTEERLKQSEEKKQAIITEICSFYDDQEKARIIIEKAIEKENNNVNNLPKLEHFFKAEREMYEKRKRMGTKNTLLILTTHLDESALKPYGGNQSGSGANKQDIGYHGVPNM